MEVLFVVQYANNTLSNSYAHAPRFKPLSFVFKFLFIILLKLQLARLFGGEPVINCGADAHVWAQCFKVGIVKLSLVIGYRGLGYAESTH